MERVNVDKKKYKVASLFSGIGGKDLRFPHHENEMAQSEQVNGHRLANFWVHNGMLETKGGKMSKSLGNTEWAKDVVADKGVNLVRWFLLSAKYRDSLVYDDETFKASETELNKIITALKQVDIKAAINNISSTDEYDEIKDKRKPISHRKRTLKDE